MHKHWNVHGILCQLPSAAAFKGYIFETFLQFKKRTDGIFSRLDEEVEFQKISLNTGNANSWQNGTHDEAVHFY
jgi:hypothetical protein